MGQPVHSGLYDAQLSAGRYSTFTDANLTAFRTVATEPGQVLLLNASMLTDPSRCTDFPLLAKLEKNLITLLSERSWRMLKKLDILSGSSLREKILMYLSYEAMYFGSMTFEIPFNRQGFADYLYADRSSLSRELGKLKAGGVDRLSAQPLHFIPAGKGAGIGV